MAVHALRVFFVVVLASMLWVTTWASLDCALWRIPKEVYGHPWFVATLFDAYWGFLTFYCWVIYKETSWIARTAWLIGVLLLGNIAMSIYALIVLFQTKPADGIEAALLRRKKA